MPVTAGILSRSITALHTPPRGDPVTARVKGGTCDEEVRLNVANEFDHLFGGFFDVFGEIVVAADDGGDHASPVPQIVLDGSPRPQGTLVNLRPRLRLVFAAQPAEKLIEIMDYSQHF